MIYLNALLKKKMNKSSVLSRQWRERLETDFKVELSPEIKIQRDKEIEPELIERNRKYLQSRKIRFLKNSNNN